MIEPRLTFSEIPFWAQKTSQKFITERNDGKIIIWNIFKCQECNHRRDFYHDAKDKDQQIHIYRNSECRCPPNETRILEAALCLAK